MKMNIDISVIIPAFNAADSIGVLLHTLLGETTLRTEIIVVDDGSTDETWTVLSAITDERLILIRQDNQGVYAARNTALAAHRGEWVVFLDADDRVSADFLQERLRTAREAQTDVVLFNARHTDSAGYLGHSVHRRQPYGKTLTGQQWIRHCVSRREWPHYLWLQIIRSAYIREHGLRFQEGKSHKDILWTIRLAAADGRFYFSDRQDYLWVNNPTSITHRPDYYDIRAASYSDVIGDILALSIQTQYRAVRRALVRHALVESRHFLGLYRRRVIERQAVRAHFRARIAFRHLIGGVSNLSDVFFLLKLACNIYLPAVSAV